MSEKDAVEYDDLDPSIGESLQRHLRVSQSLDLHRWFGRRPLALTRVATYLALIGGVDANSEILSALATSTLDDSTLASASRRIRDALIDNIDLGSDQNPSDLFPTVLDPFAGGGSVPIEAIRLGCRATAGELNPLGAAILRATVAYPCQFATEEANGKQLSSRYRWKGLLPEFENWFTRFQSDVLTRWSKIYPDGNAIIYWLWIRQARCPNVSCGTVFPLAPVVNLDSGQFNLEFQNTNSQSPFAIVAVTEKNNRIRDVVCSNCGTVVTNNDLKSQKILQIPPILAATARRSGRQLTWQASPPDDSSHLTTQASYRLAELLRGSLGRSLKRRLPHVVAATLIQMGAESFESLFSPRQLLTNLELSDAVAAIRESMVQEGMARDHVTALTTYFAFSLGSIVPDHCIQTGWNSSTGQPWGAYGRPGCYSLRKDFVERLPKPLLERWFNSTRGALAELTKLTSSATVLENNAEKLPLADNSFDAIVTDPPYFDNIPYSALTDFLWVWEAPHIGSASEQVFIRANSELEGLVTDDGDAFDDQYRAGLQNCFRECFRVLKPGRVLCLILTAKSRTHFESFIKLSETAGFELVSIKRIPRPERFSAGVDNGTFLVYLRKPTSPSEHRGLATDAAVVLERFDQGQPVKFEAVSQLFAEHLEPEDIEEIVPPGSKGSTIERLQEAVAKGDPRELLERNLGRHTLRKIAREKGLLQDGDKQSNPVDALLAYFGFRIPPPGKVEGVQQAIDILRRTASRLRQSTEVNQVSGLVSEGTSQVESSIKRGVFGWAQIAFGEKAGETLTRLLVNSGKTTVNLSRLSFGDYLTLFEALPDEISQSNFAERVRQKFGRSHIYLPKKPKNNSLGDRIRKVINVRNRVAHQSEDLMSLLEEFTSVLEMAADLMRELAFEHAIPRVGVVLDEIRDMWGRLTYRLQLDDGTVFEGTFSHKLELGHEYFFFGSEVNPRPVDPILIPVDKMGIGA